MRGGAADRGAAAPPSWRALRATIALTVLAVTGLIASPAVIRSAASVTVPAPPAELAGAIGIGLVQDSFAAGDDPRLHKYLVDHRAPDTTASRTIEITNTTPSAVQVELYTAGADIQNGTFVGTVGRGENALSSWTTVVPSTTEVPAGSRVTATVTVDIPREATTGERYAAIWAESRSIDFDGDTVVSRVGIRMYVSVGSGPEPVSDFTIDALVPQRDAAGRAVILASVHNTGARAIDLAGELELGGPGGQRPGPYDASPGTTIAVGETELVEIALADQLEAGPWDAKLTLASGLIEHVGQATVEFPDSGSSSPILIEDVRAWWLYPAGVAAVLIMIIGLAVLMAGHQRRRGERRIDEDSDDEDSTAMPASLEAMFTH